MPHASPEARAEYAREHYRRNKAAYVERALAHKASIREQGRALLEAAKDVPCMDCGGRFPTVCMDFDHVRGDKLANVADMLGNVGMAKLQAEVDKCDVVCANCHRIRTATRG